MTDKTNGSPEMDRTVDMEEDRLRQRLLVAEREVEQLRSRTRLMGVGLLVALVLSGVALFSPGLFRGADPGTVEVEVLKAKHIVLQDAEGRPRGELRVDPEGNARISLLDRQERPRLSLSVLSGGFPGMSLINANGQRRAALGLLADESTSLVFADAGGVPRTVLGLSRGDAAHLVFADAEGVSRVALGLEASGLGSVLLPEDSQPEASGGAGR